MPPAGTGRAAPAGWLDRTFRLAEHGTTVRTELVAGLTTFLTMAYIVFVNPSILGDAGMPKDAVFVATCHGNPRPMIRSNATTALIPRPEASANGRFVSSPIASVKIAAASAVPTVTASNGIPVLGLLRIAGLTKTM